jgi:hypothetical protein
MRRERRRFPRVPESVHVQCRVFGDLEESWHAVTTLNFSAGGIRFRGVEPLEAGTPLSLQVQFPGAAQPVMLRGQVVWSQMQASGVTESGVEFLEITLEQRALIDQLVGFLRRGA